MGLCGFRFTAVFWGCALLLTAVSPETLDTPSTSIPILLCHCGQIERKLEGKGLVLAHNLGSSVHHDEEDEAES